MAAHSVDTTKYGRKIRPVGESMAEGKLTRKVCETWRIGRPNREKIAPFMATLAPLEMRDFHMGVSQAQSALHQQYAHVPVIHY